MAKKHHFRIEIWTERFLGTREYGEGLLDLLYTLDSGRWVPERWGFNEPLSSRFGPDSREVILAGWTKRTLNSQGLDVAMNLLIFNKARPRMWLTVAADRSPLPRLNFATLELDAGAFATGDAPARLRRMTAELQVWSRAVYITVSFSAKRTNGRRSDRPWSAYDVSIG